MDFTRDVLKQTSEGSAWNHYSIFELPKYGLISWKFQAFRTRFSPSYQIWIINYLIHEESQLWTNVSIEYLKMWPWSRAWFTYKKL